MISQSKIRELRYDFKNSTQGAWRRGIGNEGHQVLSLDSGARLAQIYNGSDNTLIVEMHNIFIQLLDTAEAFDGLVRRNARLETALRSNGVIVDPSIPDHN